jgi:hypothetical protein
VDASVAATLAGGHDPTGGGFGGGTLGVTMAPGAEGTSKRKFKPGKGKDDSGKKKND